MRHDPSKHIEKIGSRLEGKDPLAVTLGRRGGLKGGRVRADRMTDEERSASASQAAQARWGKPKGADYEGVLADLRAKRAVLDRERATLDTAIAVLEQHHGQAGRVGVAPSICWLDNAPGDYQAPMVSSTDLLETLLPRVWKPSE